MKIQVDTMIPSSRLVPTSLNKGRPVVLEEPNSEVAASITRLAQRFTGIIADQPEGTDGAEAPPVEKKRRGLFRRR
jgi:MinD-like ATPase involved in chromosome partitioning or flagellar assembly